jgi:hypothetical protein
LRTFAYACVYMCERERVCVYICVCVREREKANEEGTVQKERSKIDSIVGGDCGYLYVHRG